jgi:hypothetical protein
MSRLGVRVLLAVAMVLLLATLTGVALAQGLSPESPYDVRAVDSMLVAIQSDKADNTGFMYAFPLTTTLPNGLPVDRAEIAAVADFDNDNMCEIVAFTTADRNLRWYEATQNTFVSTTVSSDAYPPADFYFDGFNGDSAVGDFNGDGWLDVAISGRRCSTSSCFDSGAGLVQVLLNDGNATGTAPATFTRQAVSVTGTFTQSFAGLQGIDDGQFNEGTTVDLAVQQYWAGPNNVTHLLAGAGDGTFTSSPVITHSAPGGTFSLVAGSFNSATDSMRDLIIGQDNDGDPGQAWLYTGNGAGGFTQAASSGYDTAPANEGGPGPGAGLADGFDVDDDGLLDVIAPGDGVGILFFKGLGNGSFDLGVEMDAEPVGETVTYFKAAAPPDTVARCQWDQDGAIIFDHTVYLPVIFRDFAGS